MQALGLVPEAHSPIIHSHLSHTGTPPAQLMRMSHHFDQSEAEQIYSFFFDREFPAEYCQTSLCTRVIDVNGDSRDRRRQTALRVELECSIHCLRFTTVLHFSLHLHLR